MRVLGQDRTGHTAEHEEGKGVHGRCGQVPATECRSVVGNRRAGAFEIMLS